MPKEDKRSLEEQQVIDLFHNPEFLLRIEKINTQNDILKVFRENNIKVTSETLESLYDICERYIKKGLEVIDEEKFLEDVAAGKCENIKKEENKSPKIMEKVWGIIKNSKSSE